MHVLIVSFKELDVMIKFMDVCVMNGQEAMGIILCHKMITEFVITFLRIVLHKHLRSRKSFRFDRLSIQL